MVDAKIDVCQWIEAAYMLMTARFGISSLQLSKQLGITQKSVWYLLQRLRMACGDNLEVKFRKMTGTVEIDETFLGPVVNRMNDKDRTLWEAKWGKNQRGTKGKTITYKELIKRDTEENETGPARVDPAIARESREWWEEQQRDWWEDDCIPY